MESKALAAFAALAHETRLRVLRALVQAGEGGLSAGVLAEMVEAAPSRLTFHVSALEAAGLVTSRRVSRNVVYRADYPAIGRVMHYLMHDCCCNHPLIRSSGGIPGEPSIRTL
jgi:DNA-binding transcriptional ArsR family regulator